MSNKKTILLFLLPILVSFILHLRVLNLDVLGYHVWRQSQTQTVIYHLTFTDPSPFHPQRFDFSTGNNQLLYEFPLYQWAIAQVNRCFGYSVLNSRLVTFVIFIFFLTGFYKLLRHFLNKELALIGNALLCFSPLLYYYCVNPMPDILALCFAIWSLKFFFSYSANNNWKNFIASITLLMLAGLVKLPFILYGSVYMLPLFKNFQEKKISKILIQLFLLLIAFSPVFIWYKEAIPTWKNNDLTSGILHNNKSFWQLLDYFQFHLISSVPELITNYASCAFLLIGLFYFLKDRNRLILSKSPFIVLFVFVSAYFLYELNMIEKVHDYYLMPFVPLIFLVTTYGVKQIYNKQKMKFIYFVLAIVPLTAWLRIDGRWNTINPGFNRDYLYEQVELQKLIPTNALCLIDHDDSKSISLYYLKRYGFSLFENELNPKIMSNYYFKGVRFFITENLSLNVADYSPLVLQEIYRKNLVVYKILQK